MNIFDKIFFPADGIQVAGDLAYISAKTSWGVLRALETFSQLVYENDDGSVSLKKYIFKYFVEKTFMKLLVPNE